MPSVRMVLECEGAKVYLNVLATTDCHDGSFFAGPLAEIVGRRLLDTHETCWLRCLEFRNPSRSGLFLSQKQPVQHMIH